MSWIQRYRLRNFFRSSFWLPPVVAIIAALSFAPLLRWLDGRMAWTLMDFTPDGARAVLSALASSMFTFIVFLVSTLLVVMQLASGQLTPRIIALVFRQPMVKNSLAAYTFSFAYTLAALGRIETAKVPQLSVAMAVVMNVSNLALFFYFAHWIGRVLRPITILTRIGDRCRGIVEQIYPRHFEVPQRSLAATLQKDGHRTLEYSGDSGVLLEFGAAELTTVARLANCTIELVHRVGDFVGRGDTLFKIYPPHAAVEDAALCQMVAIGPERTLKQDPAFALRIMVDIALKALSPAINDPTTAVVAIDQIHRLLRHIGKRALDSGEIRDDDGRLLLSYSTLDWNDYVQLAVSEIRLAGAQSLQVARRLYAMLDHLIDDLPEQRADPLRLQLVLLNKAVERSYDEAEDRASAARGDLQGIGGEEKAA